MNLISDRTKIIYLLNAQGEQGIMNKWCGEQKRTFQEQQMGHLELIKPVAYKLWAM